MSAVHLKPGTTFPTIVGRVLAHLRDQRRMLQGQMAGRMGLSPSTWSRVENGSLALNLDQLSQAAAILGTTPSDILLRAEAAERAARLQGLKVERSRVPDPLAAGIAIVAVGVLAGIIAAAISEKTDR